MKKLYLSKLFLCLFFYALSGQEYCPIDGWGNNLSDPSLGAVESPLYRYVANGFTDGLAAPAGADRANPRHISNVVAKQEAPIFNTFNLTDYLWAWGQFVDHDITLVPDNFLEPMRISVPLGDPQFDPYGSGTAVIPMFRSVTMAQSGIHTPRDYPNAITHYIDGSNIYGSDEERMTWLRTFRGGKLKTSAGGNLPFNTIDGQWDSPLDPDAPHMDNANPFVSKLFVAGDPRANEHIVLIAMHTLFVREHNRLCDDLAAAHPDWGDEQLFWEARQRVIAIIQAITYRQWLPAMGIRLPNYRGYDPEANPSIMNVFSAAAFRLGHSLLGSTILRLDNRGKEIPQGNIGLKEAFFNPAEFIDGGGLAPLLKGLANQRCQQFDTRIVEDVRSFLFGPPGAGGLDLAAININRGRERGLPDYNTVRADFGLPKHRRFEDITSDPTVAAALASLYRSVDDIDPWVGMLAEGPDFQKHTFLGETVREIIGHQFKKLRDGDRFYYENDPTLTRKEQMAIKNTTLSEVIRRNAAVGKLQHNVFRLSGDRHRKEEPFVLNESGKGGKGRKGLEAAVFPNPVASYATLQYQVPQTGVLNIYLMDGLGRKLATLYTGMQERGTHQLELSAAAVMPAKGTYWVVIQSGALTEVLPVVKR